ncbi:ankyrin repeat domain-containing protein [Pedobacter agri]|uniref:ankyrin repeat domain-containing protein n=1 Tax=Pedobacter agri TaxID=454586 RepID=UPI00292D7DAD|nr:ankyrin repeat domain-containing protein [Pedobacter agri]
MKTLIISSFLILAVFLTKAQNISSNLKQAFKTDDVSLFKRALQEDKIVVDSCLLLEQKPYSLFAISIRSKSIKILQDLISIKADVNKICDDKSPLMYAAKYGELEAAKALVKAGANIGLKNREGKTALDYARKYEKKELIDYLSK